MELLPLVVELTPCALDAARYLFILMVVAVAVGILSILIAFVGRRK